MVSAHFFAASGFGSFMCAVLSYVKHCLLFICRILEGIGMTMGWHEARTNGYRLGVRIFRFG
jgi:hypothetical protein